MERAIFLQKPCFMSRLGLIVLFLVAGNGLFNSKRVTQKAGDAENSACKPGRPNKLAS